jgi:arylsulfatase A-like enzyme
LADKRSAYEESIRIPLLVRYPKLGAKGKTIDALALNIDLAPTLLDFAGVRVPKEMQGRSWRPLLEGKKVKWREAFLYEYFYERNYAVPTTLAVRTESAKLIRYPGHDDWTELYDLRADPYETKNLVNDPAHRKLLKQMQAEDDRQTKAVKFRVPDAAHPVPANPVVTPAGE